MELWMEGSLSCELKVQDAQLGEGNVWREYQNEHKKEATRMTKGVVKYSLLLAEALSYNFREEE